jgi:hypothetical protein
MNIDKIINEEINKHIVENIISEEINSFLNENGFFEVKKKKAKKKKGPKDTGKNAKKLRNGLRTDFNYKQERETNPNLNNQDSEDLIDILDSPYVDLAAVAQDIYPDHTPEGAQSQLRKKVKGLKSDSGSTYKIKKKEAFKLRRALAKEIN